MTRRFSSFKVPFILLLSFILLSVVTGLTISFISPSPTEGSVISSSSVILNVSTTEIDNQTYTFSSEGLVGWWRMDNNSIGENNTLVLDHSGISNNGTALAGAIPNAGGKFAGGFTINGINQYITIPRKLDSEGNSILPGSNNSAGGKIRNPAEFSYSLWIYPDGNQSRYFFGNQGGSNVGYGARINIAGTITCEHRSSNLTADIGTVTITSATAIQNNSWHHVACVYSKIPNSFSPDTFNITRVVYIDGIMSGFSGANNTAQAYLTGSSAVHRIGSGSPGTPNAMNGSIDEVLIFNRTLNGTEVGSLYNSSQYSLQKEFANLQEGFQNYTFNSVNSSGFRSIKSLTFTTDYTKPLVNFTNPTTANGSTINYNSTIVNFTSTDTNFANITIRMHNATALLNTSTLSSGHFFLNFTNLPDGVYYYNATATDLANQQNSTETRTLTITTNVADTTFPTIFFATPTQSNGSSTFGDVIINFTGIEANLQNGWVTFNGVNFTATCIGATSYSCIKTFSGLSDGIYTYQAFVNDTSGNQNNTDWQSIIKETSVESGGGRQSSPNPLNITNVTLQGEDALNGIIHANNLATLSKAVFSNMFSKEYRLFYVAGILVLAFLIILTFKKKENVQV
jgi:hypothetical protein